MTTLLFYENPVPVQTDKHQKTKIKPLENKFRFAAKTNSVILSGVEFVEAAKEYPIVFTRIGGEGNPIPLALLGLRNDENLFVQKDGAWDARYIPAFVRRYPFVLSKAPKGEQFMVCVDESYPGMNEEEGAPLFDEKGEQTPLLANAVNFLQDYQAQIQRTEQFTKTLIDNELLVDLTARATGPDQAQYSLGGLMAIDEKKLRALPDDKVLALFKSGELGWIYSHLVSLSNLPTLANRLSKNLNEGKAAKPAAKKATVKRITKTKK
ncbi:MAG: SapC family protein [Magnetococcales bacterium]|nr:SapC family protein [Magnetococcales bacterium]